MPPDRGVTITPAVVEPVSASVASGRNYAWHVPRGLRRAWNEVNRDENRSLYYYRTHVSKNISSHFDTDFWNEFVLRVSEEEPAIKHAILALSALYEADETYQLLHLPNDRYNYLKRFAIYQYNNAISTLLNRIGTGKPLLEVVIMSCLVFTWVEFMRKNVDNAMIHLQSGLRILFEQRQRVGSSVLAKEVAHILCRVLIQATLHRSSTVEFDYYAIIGYNPGLGALRFETLREARGDLDGKISSALHFFRSIERSRLAELHHRCYASQESPCLKCIYQFYLDGLSQWGEAFQDLRDRLDIDALDANALQALRQLELSYLLMSNTLDTLFATTPMIFDKYNNIYARIVQLCRRVLQDQTLRRTNSVFTFPFDNGVQRALFYIVLRCRDMHIRREAVQLLQLCPDSESIWQRTSLIAFCNWKINIEEKGRPQGAHETDPLPENARVYAEKARELVRDGQTRMVIRFKRGALGGHRQDIVDEEEVANMSTRLTELLGMWGQLSLYTVASRALTVPA